jgi:hypothetical protein
VDLHVKLQYVVVDVRMQNISASALMRRCNCHFANAVNSSVVESACTSYEALNVSSRSIAAASDLGEQDR